MGEIGKSKRRPKWNYKIGETGGDNSKPKTKEENDLLGWW